MRNPKNHHQALACVEQSRESDITRKDNHYFQDDADAPHLSNLMELRGAAHKNVEEKTTSFTEPSRA